MNLITHAVSCFCNNSINFNESLYAEKYNAPRHDDVNLDADMVLVKI